MSNSAHYSVLLQESVTALVQKSDGQYVDGTFGRGGHAQKILTCLSPLGRLYGFDKDPQAIAVGEQLAAHDSRFAIFHASFAQMAEFVKPASLDGVLLDLGVSSPQLDQADRGFSFMHDGPLDMRMNNAAGLSAADWVAQTAESEMIQVFRDYGEERYAKRIAGAIIKARAEAPITRTLQLAEIVKVAHPRWEKHKHPATRVFQAIRIEINKELADLEAALDAALDLLAPGGRLVVISFHSLEDRIVKRFFRRYAQGKKLPAFLPVTDDMLDIRLRLVGKATKAGEGELDENIRSRSAVLRVAERLA